MRAAFGVVLIAFAGPVVAQPNEYASTEGKYTVKFPDAPKVTSQTAKSAVGDLKVNIATFANSDGNAFMVSYTDFPAVATKEENHGTLFEGIRNGAKGTDGKLVGEEKELKFGPDKLPGREFTIEKGKQRIRFRVILNGGRVYQVAAIGTEAFVTGNSGTTFLDSFQITK